MPQFFKNEGYYTSSIGKVFHPNLPADFDYPSSWTDPPFFSEKPECPRNTMGCPFSQFANNSMDVDNMAVTVALRRLREFSVNDTYTNFFVAVGLQSPRLPWSYPDDVANKIYPYPFNLSITRNRKSHSSNFEWFRQNEINLYSDIRNVTHKAPMAISKQHAQRRNYFSAVTHIDNMVGRILHGLKELSMEDSTNIILFADHGQNLGEFNMWSMMNLLESRYSCKFCVSLSY